MKTTKSQFQLNFGDSGKDYIFGFDATQCTAWRSGKFQGSLTNPMNVVHTYNQYGTYTVTGEAVDLTDPSDVLTDSLEIAITTASKLPFCNKSTCYTLIPKRITN